VNLTGDILHVYQGFRGFGGGQGYQDLETRTGSGKPLFTCAFGMSGTWEVRIVHCVNFQTGHVLAPVELEFAGILHAEIQVVGTGGLINAGGPFWVSGGPLNSVAP